MTIQFNTDHNINGDEAHSAHFTSLIAGELDRYSERISRIEVHLADENGSKQGQNDKRCILEARVNGMQPIAVTNHADTVALAVDGAIDKLKASLDSIIGRLNEHQN